MGFVNQLIITADISTLDSLAFQFGNKIRAETAAYGGVVLIFDRYDDSLQNLKKHTWEVCHQNRVQYSLSGNAIIKNIKHKELLSHPENKQKMCEVFSKGAFTSDVSNILANVTPPPPCQQLSALSDPPPPLMTSAFARPSHISK